MLSSTMRRVALLASRRAVSRPVISSFRYLAPACENVALFFSTDERDIDDESDIIELGKEELEEMKHGPDYKTFDTKSKSRKDDITFLDVEDESDLIELAKEEEEDMAKGIDFSDRNKRVYPNKKIVRDIEDDSDVIEYAKEAASEEKESSRGGKASAARADAQKDGIEFDIEDESDLIEVAKEEAQAMEKQNG